MNILLATSGIILLIPFLQAFRKMTGSILPKILTPARKKVLPMPQNITKINGGVYDAAVSDGKAASTDKGSHDNFRVTKAENRNSYRITRLGGMSNIAVLRKSLFKNLTR